MAISNRERVGRGLELLKTALIPFVEREHKARLGENWFDAIKDHSREPLKRNKAGQVAWDNQTLLKAMIDSWQAVFKQTLGYAERSLVGELLDVRNRWAHENPFSTDDTYRALDSIQRLLTSISAPEAAELDAQKQEVLRTRFSEQARQVTRGAAPTEGTPLKGLRAWREVITPHDDVASGGYQQAEFAADLAQVRRREGAAEYREPKEFFQRTFITEGLKDLLTTGLKRLTGNGGDPVVELQTNFGGGKTHSMLALFHLFDGGTAADLPGIEPILQAVKQDRAPQAKRAVLVGTAVSPGQATKQDDGTVTHTLWGELAWQLGGKKGYAMVAEADKNGTSPGSDDLRKLFDAFSPCLVLIDEWVAYARQLIGQVGLPAGSFEAQATFAQALTEAAKTAKQTFLVASVPASQIELGGDNGQKALDILKNVFQRLGSTWKPATAEEGFEIVRRRLFKPIAANDFPGRDAVVDAFAKMYRDEPQEFPPGCNEGAYRRRLLDAYPIHPELFDRLYGDWSTLDKFQRTRGVLRLMAAVIHRLWERNDASLMILPGSIPIDDGPVQFELTRYLEDQWTPVMERDIDGPNSSPIAIDRSNPNFGRYSASRRVSRTIYLGSAPNSKGAKPGIDDRSIRLGCVQPGETAATFGDALRRLTDQATYLYVDGRRYWFSTQPSVTRLAQDRAAQQGDDEVWEELKKRLRDQRDARGRGDFAGVHACPDSSAEVPDEPEARLVVLDPSATHTQRAKESEALTQAKEIWAKRGTSQRIFRNTLVFLGPDKQRLGDLELAVRQYLAWSSIHKEREELNLDGFQRRQAEAKVEDAEKTVKLRIAETWVHLLFPTQANGSAEIEWSAELRLQAGDDPLAVRASKKLVGEERLMPVMGGPRLQHELAKYIWVNADHVSVKQLWDYFSSYPYLPRLRDWDVLVKAIHDGLARMDADQMFAYADGYDEVKKTYQGLRIAKDGVVELSGLVVRPEPAKAAQAAKGKTPPTGTAVVSPTGTPAPPSAPTSAPEVPPRIPRVFIGSIELNADRLGRDAGRIAEEVVQHLSLLPSAQVTVAMEVRVEVEDGIPDKVTRTVSENCKTLKFKSFGFESS